MKLVKLFVLLVIALPVAALVAVWMCFQDAPLVVRKADISADDIERAKRILEKHDPRKAKDGDAARHRRCRSRTSTSCSTMPPTSCARASTRVVLQPGTATVQASLEVPGSPFGPWLNVDAALRETGGLPAFDHLKIGSLPVPGFIADLALERLAAHLNATAEGRLANDVVKSVKFSEARVQVVYEWRDDIPDRVRAALLPPADQERLKAYSDRLAEVVDRRARRGRFRSRNCCRRCSRWRSSARPAAMRRRRIARPSWRWRSTRTGADCRRSFRRRRRGASPRRARSRSNGRDDFPQHFLISAAIAAEAGSPLADAIGLYKEVEDSRGGSGFSFDDIAADRAGTRFGVLAVKAPQKLQAALAAGVKERDFMPDVSDLPEFMQEAEFKKRYGGIGAPAYQKMMADIEARMAAPRFSGS